MKSTTSNLGKASSSRSMTAKALHMHHFMLIEGNGDIYCPFMKELGMISAEYMTLIIKLKKLTLHIHVLHMTICIGRYLPVLSCTDFKGFYISQYNSTFLKHNYLRLVSVEAFGLHVSWVWDGWPLKYALNFANCCISNWDKIVFKFYFNYKTWSSFGQVNLL